MIYKYLDNILKFIKEYMIVKDDILVTNKNGFLGLEIKGDSKIRITRLLFLILLRCFKVIQKFRYLYKCYYIYNIIDLL